MSQQPPSPPDQLLALPGLDDEEEDAQAAVSPPGPPWWRGRSAIIAATALALIILGIIFIPRVFQRRQMPPYQTQAVARGDLVLSISATGPLQGGIYNIVFNGTG